MIGLGSNKNLTGTVSEQKEVPVSFAYLHNPYFSVKHICVSLQKTIINNLRLNPAPVHGNYLQNDETVKKGLKY